MMKKLMILLFLVAKLSYAQQEKVDSLWSDPLVEQQIEEGIEKHRKGDFVLKLAGLGKGDAEIRIEQVGHEFLFGANAFMVGGFEEAEKNQQYGQVFDSLFNLATVPFYWKTLEPQQGNRRFEKGSEPIYRRPAPDAVLEFCQTHQQTPKGHTLIWNNPSHSVPDWLPKDTAAIEELMEERIKIIAERYGDKIKTWDVVNEMLHYFPQVIMPKDYVYKSFKMAEKYFPADTRLFINEVTSVWLNPHEYSPYNLLIDNLLKRGTKIDGIGLQYHFFNEAVRDNVLAGKAMRPKDLTDALNLYGAYNLPIHVSEITVPAMPNTAEGQAYQAKLTRNYYRLWFSHPAVESIIWWNVVDGTAVKGEDVFNGGILNNDFSKKPVYGVLDELINKDWKTNIMDKLSDQGEYSFRGYYGKYRISIKQKGKKVIEKQVAFTRDAPVVSF